MNDILDQMIVTAANGEKIMFFNFIDKAAKEGNREECEARRMDNLMKLGVKEHEYGPMKITSVSVGLIKD